MPKDVSGSGGFQLLQFLHFSMPITFLVSDLYRLSSFRRLLVICTLASELPGELQKRDSVLCYPSWFNSPVYCKKQVLWRDESSGDLGRGRRTRWFPSALGKWIYPQYIGKPLSKEKIMRTPSRDRVFPPDHEGFIAPAWPPGPLLNRSLRRYPCKQ